jgi:uncharacterized damage-inducible protein DinB
MEMNQILLTEFDLEIARTRKTLERLPDDKCGYKPHEKSMSLLKLANHVADIPLYISLIFARDELDLMQPRDHLDPPANCVERLERFDIQAAAARERLAQATDEQFDARFTLRAGERIVFSDPRYFVLRNLFFNHMIHHRAQLGLYLRLNDCPVPSIYGPSADEG